MKIKNRLLMISCALLVGGTIAPSAKADMGILAGYNMFSPSTSPSSATSKGGWLGGVSFATRIVPMFSFEIDGLYVNRKANAFGIDAEENVIQIPALLRFHLFPMFNIGAGLFYSMAIGDVTANGTSESYADANQETSDYGAVGSLQFKLPLGNPMTHLVIEGRYTYGLKEQLVVPGGSSFKNRDIQAIAGITFGMN